MFFVHFGTGYKKGPTINSVAKPVITSVGQVLRFWGFFRNLEKTVVFDRFSMKLLRNLTFSLLFRLFCPPRQARPWPQPRPGPCPHSAMYPATATALEANSRCRPPGHRPPVTGHQSTGHRVTGDRVTGHRPAVTGHRSPGHRPRTGHRSPVTGSPATGDRSSGGV